MKKGYIIFFLFVVVGFVILSRYLYQDDSTTMKNEEVTIVRVSGDSDDLPVQSDFAKYLEKKKKYSKENKDQVEEESEEYWNRMVTIAEGRKKEILFFGRVLDQNNTPVSGAQVLYSANSGFLVEGDGRSTIETNSEGVFEIRNVFGTGLQIISILKPGYKVDINGFEVGGRYYSNFQSNSVLSNVI